MDASRRRFPMTVVDRMERFSGQFGKHLVVDGAERDQVGFSRRVDVISLGRLGHAAVLVDPNAYADLLERALA